eukprot:956817-Amphidinium_carterae.1
MLVEAQHALVMARMSSSRSETWRDWAPGNKTSCDSEVYPHQVAGAACPRHASSQRSALARGYKLTLMKWLLRVDIACANMAPGRHVVHSVSYDTHPFCWAA